MTRGVAIYVEGGGKGASSIAIRQGMLAFLKPVVELARKRRIQFSVIPHRDRRRTYDAFADALKNSPEFHNILLVDSEDAVADIRFPWKHLQNRELDRWQQPVGATDEQCHMMVVCMEAWFLADPDALKKYFGNRFDSSKLPRPDRAESTNNINSAIINALTKAAKGTPRKKYDKIRDGAGLLKRINPDTVKKHCAWCKWLFDTLEDLVANF